MRESYPYLRREGSREKKLNFLGSGKEKKKFIHPRAGGRRGRYIGKTIKD